MPWQPPERRREDKAAGRREWAASRAWRQRVCSRAPAPAPPRPGPRAAAAAAAHSSPVRARSGGHGRDGRSWENKTRGKRGERSPARQMCREDLETPPPPQPPPCLPAGSSRPQLHHAGRGVGVAIAKAVRPAWRARPGAASHYREGPVALGAGGRAGVETEGVKPWNQVRRPSWAAV